MSEPVYEYTELGNDGEPVLVRKTRTQVLAEYYGWWCQQMRKVGREEAINEACCIADWMTVHWAWEVKESNANKS